jgi:hypothetical protein
MCYIFVGTEGALRICSKSKNLPRTFSAVIHAYIHKCIHTDIVMVEENSEGAGFTIKTGMAKLESQPRPSQL